MSDKIGNVDVPEISPSGTFPLVTDYPHVTVIDPKIVIHPFVGANFKIEQKFVIGNGAKQWRAQWSRLHDSDFAALKTFWESRKGAYQPFTLNLPSNDGQSTTPTIVRFVDMPLSWERFAGAVVNSGVAFVEVPSDDDAPVYDVTRTLDRFPDTSLETALLLQIQEFVPLVEIQPKEAGYPKIYLSDRRCILTGGSGSGSGTLYHARLLTWSGISQRIGGQADSAKFSFGNADRVMKLLNEDVDLFEASIQFSLYHVNTQTRIDLWAGEVLDFQQTARTQFDLSAVDPLYKTTLQYPTDTIRPLCNRNFNDGGGCPFSTQGNGSDPMLGCDRGLNDSG